MHTPRLPQHLALALLVAGVALTASPSLSQTKKQPADKSVQMIEFGDDPVSLESVGLTVPIPVGARSEQTRVGERASLKITDERRTWQVNIQTPQSQEAGASAESFLEEFVINLFASTGQVYDATPNEKAKLIAYKALIVDPLTAVKTAGGVDAQRIYVRLPPEDSKKSTAVIRGYVVIKCGEKQFISFELVTPEAEFPRSRKVFETMLAAATVEDATLVNAQRQVAIEAGSKIFDSLDATRMQEVIAACGERWERLYEASETGSTTDDKEIGYRRVRASVGKGPLESAGAPQGYLVQIDARVLLPNDYVCDSQGVFFMTPDRRRENWTVTNTIRDLNPIKDKRKKSATTREVGARDGTSLSIHVEGDAGKSDFVKPKIEGAGYISQVEAWLLPQILVRSGISAEFAFYSYRAEPQQILFRRDDVKQSADKPDVWTVSTRLSRSGSEQVTTLNSKGEVIRTRLGNGSMWEPISFAQLKRLWDDKGLPTE